MSYTTGMNRDGLSHCHIKKCINCGKKRQSVYNSKNKDLCGECEELLEKRK